MEVESKSQRAPAFFHARSSISIHIKFCRNQFICFGLIKGDDVFAGELTSFTATYENSHYSLTPKVELLRLISR